MTDTTTPAPDPGSKPLKSAKQEGFSQHYARHGNATRAAKEAGYSEKTAYSQGHDLLKKPEIIDRVAFVKTGLWKALHMGPEETLSEIAKIARASMGRMLHITPGGDPYIDLSKADPDTMDAIAEATIEDFTDGREVDEKGETIKRDVRRVKVKMHPKLGALQTLAKHHGLLNDKVDLNISDDFADTMVRAQQRAKEARRKRDAA